MATYCSAAPSQTVPMTSKFLSSWATYNLRITSFSIRFRLGPVKPFTASRKTQNLYVGFPMLTQNTYKRSEWKRKIK